ncbi:MAG: 50S ribosomal protein L18 [Minisyncoccia bacterium]
MANIKKNKKERRQRRVRAKIFGTLERPRLSVFRSSLHIYAQLINDQEGKTLISASDLEVKKDKKTTKQNIAKEVGQLIAHKAKEKNISQAVFDRGSYKYHGRVKELAEGAREGGLQF